jgi:hypothetical protein
MVDVSKIIELKLKAVFDKIACSIKALQNPSN